MRVAVDLDGVVRLNVRKDNGWESEVLEEAFQSLKWMIDKGWVVFILSCRLPVVVEKWLKEKGWDYPMECIRLEEGQDEWDKKGVLGITNVKLIADVYLDDRAVRFTNWTNAIGSVTGVRMYNHPMIVGDNGFLEAFGLYAKGIKTDKGLKLYTDWWKSKSVFNNGYREEHGFTDEEWEDGYNAIMCAISRGWG